MVEIKDGHELETPMITVITLSYNSEFLLESIYSVLDQTYPKIEYIIVDDGSQVFNIDMVCFYIEEHRRENLVDYKIIVNPKNMGTVKASNIAIKHSRGEYLFNLAADDVFYDVEVLQKWVGEFIARGSLIMTAQSAVYDSTLMSFQKMLPEEDEISLLMNGNAQDIFNRLCYANFIYGCCTARSRKLIETYGLYDEEYRIIEDYPSVLSLSRRGAVIDFWKYPVVKYRQGGVSSLENFNPAYTKDSNRIFQKEILPYTTHKWMFRFYYYKWKLYRHCARLKRNLLKKYSI